MWGIRIREGAFRNNCSFYLHVTICTTNKQLCIISLFHNIYPKQPPTATDIPPWNILQPMYYLQWLKKNTLYDLYTTFLIIYLFIYTLLSPPPPTSWSIYLYIFYNSTTDIQFHRDLLISFRNFTIPTTYLHILLFIYLFKGLCHLMRN